MMKDIYVPSLSDPLYQGAQGNASVAESKVSMTNLVTNDQIHLFNLPPGIRINGLQITGQFSGPGKSLQFVLLQPPLKEVILRNMELGASGELYSTLSVKPITTGESGGVVALRIKAGPINITFTVLLRYTVIGY
ncbi:hypothetical protein [Edwardsiella tarda]|uniref:hypothetical protein n=1 Tax=Edwardsiella tarda TaxID=636 RepID=UPI00031658F3|nr:hypothetical protein [Edwardsiella tarda]